MAMSKAAEKLACLGYNFNQDLQLCSTRTGQAFRFVDQRHYEELADAVAKYVQARLVEKHGLVQVDLPSELEDEGHFAKAPIFASEGALQKEVLLVLLCGTGAVAAGQWARKLCINDSLYSGSVIPFVEWAETLDFGIVVLNPNYRTLQRRLGSQEKYMSSDEHVICAWDSVLSGSAARHMLLVAHSYGGVCTCSLLKDRGEEVLPKLRCVAFTDSVHSGCNTGELPLPVRKFLVKDCVNWVGSEKPLDTVVAAPRGHFDPEPEEEAPGPSTHLQAGSLQQPVCDDEGGGGVGDSQAFPGGTASLTGDSRLCGGPWQGARDSKSQGKVKKKQPEKTQGRLDSWFQRKEQCDCSQISAGTVEHELTTWSAFPSIRRFLLSKLQEAGDKLPKNEKGCQQDSQGTEEREQSTESLQKNCGEQISP